jgi:hypothetical protein
MLSLGSGCSTFVSNDRTHSPVTVVQPTYFKPIFQVQSRQIKGYGEYEGFFNFDFSSPSLSVVSDCDRFVEPDLFEGLSSTEANALRNAIYNTCKSNGAEYLLMPHFEIRTKKFPILSFIWAKSTCVLYGIPARVEKVVPVEMPTDAKVDIQLSASGKTESAK